jgi:lipopolysaccharide transport system ATP-binding protein
MSDIVISVENLSKTYRLGVIGTGTFFGDLNRWWAKKLGKPDPYAKIGQVDHGNREGETLWALDNVSFKLQQGEALGIIGRNGAGKSTLLKIMSRVTAPTSGEVKVKGRIASLLEVGTGFHPELTGRENIYLNGAILGMNRPEVTRKLEEIVDFSGVAKFIDTPVKRYSSGMYVRLAFAVAAHLEPEILVVDEVLAVGDAEFQKKCLGKMSDVASGGRTVLFVSHNLAAVSNLCQKSILMDKGRILHSGETEDVILKYMNLNKKVGSSRFDLKEDQINEQPRITNIDVLNSRGEPVDTIFSGEKMSIELAYASTRVNPLSQVSVSAVFSNELGENIFCCWSDLIDANFNNLPPTGKLNCDIPKIPLTAGKYYLSFNLVVDRVTTDRMPQAIEINVFDGNFFPTGKVPPRKLGVFYIEHDWKYHE